MTTILLVRHAEVVAPDDVLLGRNDEVGLSAQGLERATTLARRLRRLPISSLWSSPLRRALQTAMPIGGEHGIPVRIASSLNEIDYGRWTGRRFAELGGDPDWRSFNGDRSRAQIPEGEKLRAVEQRVGGQINEWIQAYPGFILAVTHAEIIRIAVLRSLGLSSDCYDRIEISLCSVSALAFDGRRPRVICLNGSGELDCIR